MTIQQTDQPTITGGSIPYGKKALRTPFLIGIRLFIACLLIQLLTVGMAVFVNPSWWTNHNLFSHFIGVLGLLLFLVTLFGRFPRTIVMLTGLMNVLFFVQGSTANLVRFPQLALGAAFHPVNALLLFWIAMAIARKTQCLLVDGTNKQSQSERTV